jgi:hypothetical protein
MSEKLAAMYAVAGVSIFPCHESDHARGKAKGPYTRNGYHDASTNSCQLQIWERAYPTAIYGLPCASNGAFVLNAEALLCAVRQKSGMIVRQLKERSVHLSSAGDGCPPAPDIEGSGDDKYRRAT